MKPPCGKRQVVISSEVADHGAAVVYGIERGCVARRSTREFGRQVFKTMSKCVV